jgi:GntR family transcriptional repressor for pyruvate dehydrogenase complex
MKISRTIVHSGLIELNTKGLITVIPRKGTFVNDFRVNGTLAILDSLVNYKGELDERLLDSMLETRFLIEVENAGLAAANRDNYDLIKLNEIIKCEDAADYKNIEEIVNVDFTFHHQVAMATKNIIYPLIIKSFEGTYKNLTTKFFKKTM